MVRRSPNKSKRAPSAGVGITSPLTQSQGVADVGLNSTFAPRLEPQDSPTTDETYSPTRSTLRSPNKPLAHQVNSLQREKELADNKLWEASIEIQEKTRQKTEDDEHIRRLQSELNSLRTEHDQNAQLLEELRGHEAEITSALSAAKEQAAHDKKASLEKIESRDEFIDSLQAQIDTLRSELSSMASKVPTETTRSAPIEESGSANSTSLDGELTEDQSFSKAVLTHGSADSAMESLALSGHQKHQQNSLRRLLQKQRLENMALRRRLADLTGSSLQASSLEEPFSDNESADLTFNFDDESGSRPASLVDAENLIPKAGFTLSDELQDAETPLPSPDQRQSTKTPPASLYSQARAFKHELIPISKYEELTSQASANAAAAGTVPVGFEELRRLAAQLDYSVMSNEEYQKLDKLLRGKHAPKGIQSHVLQDLVRQNTFELRTPTKIRAAWGASHDVPRPVREYADKYDLALIPTSLSAFIELAATLGLVTLPREQIVDLAAGARPMDPAWSNEHLLCPIPKSKLSEVSRLVRQDANPSKFIYNPSKDELSLAAASHGLALMPVKQFERFRGELSNTDDIPVAVEVAKLAKKAGLQVIPENPTIDELQHVISNDIVLVERSTYEALEVPGPATLRRLAKHHDMVVLPRTDVEQLQRRGKEQVAEPTAHNGEEESAVALLDKDPSGIPVEKLREIAEKKDLILLSARDYQQMLKLRDAKGFSHLPMAERTKHLEELIQSQAGGSPNSLTRQSPGGSLGTMADRARRMGMILITPEEFQELKKSQSMYEPTKADVIKSAKEFGLATMPIDELSNMRARVWKSNVEQFAAKSPRKNASKDDADAEFTAVPLDYLATLRRIVESPKRGEVESMASKAGLVVADPEEYDNQVRVKANALGLIDPSDETSLREKAKELNMTEVLTADQIRDAAPRFGFVHESNETEILRLASSLGLVKPPSDQEITERGKSLGLIVPYSDKELEQKALQAGLVHPPTATEITAKARLLGMVDPLTSDEIRSQALELGLVEAMSEAEILHAARSLGLSDPMTEQDIKDKAISLGLIYPPTEEELRASAKKLGLAEPMTENEILDSARSLGLVSPPSDEDIISKAQKLGLAYPLSDAEIMERAAQLGLVKPLSDDEVKTKAKTLGLIEALSEQEILARAQELNYGPKLSDVQIALKARELGFAPELSEDDIVSKALQLGLVRPPTDEAVLAKARDLGLSEPLSNNDIISKAKEIGLVDPPSDSDVVSLAKALGLREPPTDEEIKARALDLGLRNPISEEEIKDQAMQQGLIDPSNDEEIVQRAKHLGLVDPPTDEDTRQKGKALGLIDPPTSDEIIEQGKKLGLAEPLNDEEILQRGMTLGLIQPPNDEQILTKARDLGLSSPLLNVAVMHRAKDLGLVPPPTDAEIVTRAKQLDLQEPLSDDEIRARARDLGMDSKMTDSDTLARAKQLGLRDPISDGEVINKAKQLGLVEPLNDATILEKAATLGWSPTLSRDELTNKALTMGLVRPPSKESVLEKAKAMGLIDPATDTDEVLRRAHDLGLIRQPSEEDLRNWAQSHGFVDRTDDEEIKQRALTLGLTPPPSDEEILSRARHMGLVNMPSKEAMLAEAKAEAKAEAEAEAKRNHSDSVNEDEILGKARGLGLVDPPSDDEIVIRATHLGLIPPMDDSDILQRAEVILEAATTTPVENLSDELIENIKTIAKNMGLSEPMSAEQIRDAAKRQGLVEPHAEWDAAKPLGGDVRREASISDAEVIARAKALGFVYKVDAAVEAAKKDAPAQATAGLLPVGCQGGHSAARSNGSVEPAGNAAATLQQSSPSSGGPQRAEEPQNVLTNDRPNDAAVVAMARPMRRNLAKADAPASSAAAAHESAPATGTNSGDNDGEHAETSEAASRAAVSRAAAESSEAPSRVTDTPKRETARSFVAPPPRRPTAASQPSTPLGSSKLSHTGLPHNMSTASTATPGRLPPRKYEVRTPRRPRGITRSSTVGSIHSHLSDAQSSIASTLRLPTRSRANSGGHRTLGSISSSRHGTTYSGAAPSNWSISTPPREDAVAYLSQIMMGEVLHKYYGGINFEGLTGGRHRRYFWYRPEKNLLYWHRENPVFLGNSAAKSISVAGVEEIVDRNPIPAGLYHRTLVIRGVERDVRVTCSTQGRHYVWLIALQYVVSQLAEGED